MIDNVKMRQNKTQVSIFTFWSKLDAPTITEIDKSEYAIVLSDVSKPQGDFAFGITGS